MKKSYLFVLYIFFSASSYAGLAQLPALNEPAPVQSYESTQTPVKSISPVSDSKKLTPTVAQTLPPAGLPSMKQVRELELQVNELSQAVLLSQQAMNQKIEKVSLQNQQLQNKVQQLTEAMLFLEQKIKADHHHNTIHESHFSINERTQVGFFVMIVLLVVVFGVLISRQKYSA